MVSFAKEQKYCRGDVWWVNPRSDGEGVLGSNGRPGVILSSQFGCDTSHGVIVAYMSTAVNKGDKSVNVPIYSMRRPGIVCCNQIQSVDKSWLKSLTGHLTETEMAEVDKALFIALGLGIDEAVSHELEELKCKYEAALQIIAQHEVMRDIAFLKKKDTSVLPTKTVELEAASAEPMKGDISPDDRPLDLNTATYDDLRNIGLSQENATSIIQKRPFKDMDDVQQTLRLTNVAVKLLTAKKAYVSMPAETQLSRPPQQSTPARLNFNTCEEDELVELLEENGFSKTATRCLVRMRYSAGKSKARKYFSCVDELPCKHHVGEKARAKLASLVDF